MGKNVYPLRLSDDPQSAINLMLWVWVKDFGIFERLCANKTKHKARDFYCMRCLSAHNTQDSLDKHLVDCHQFEACGADKLKPGEKLRFENHHNQLKCPYVSTFLLSMSKTFRKHSF